MKRKQLQDNEVGPSTKKSKKERRHKNKHASVNEEFVLVEASLVVSIPPVFASNPSQGVQEMLDSMIMRYIPPLRGVVLTHSNLRFLQSTANIQGDTPYATCNVGFDATVWSPRVGQRLTGMVNLGSPDHISLLVHRTFNVSIPRHHIPQTEWVFESEAATSSDRWVHAVTRLPLGGDNATVEFTVIGLTIANQMLSLVGSIQPDPFSPHHVTPAQNVHIAVNQDLDSEEPEPKNDPEGQEHKWKKNSEGKGHKRKKHAEEQGHKGKVDPDKVFKREKRKAADTEERKPRNKKKEDE